MAGYFPLGVGQLWDDLQQMQASGLYWTHVEQEPAAKGWCQQVLAAQAPDSQVALITVGDSSGELLADLHNVGPKQIALFSLPAHALALNRLASDLHRGLKGPQNQLLMLNVNARTWQKKMSGPATHAWLVQMAAWLRQNNCCLLVVSYGAGGEELRSQLQHEHRSLWGLAGLHRQQDSYLYQLVFWANQQGLSAHQELRLEPSTLGWQLAATEQAQPQSLNDDHEVYCHQSVLEGGVPPSEHWRLFASNSELAAAALTTQAATIVFALQYNRDIETVACKLHKLRRHCGKGIKLIVREVGVRLRQADERLLLACGANLVFSHYVPLSRLMVQLEGIQGQRYSRYVPADITPLLDALIPLKLKGVLKPEPFCTALAELMMHPAVAKDAKGVLVALQTVPGLKPAQALTLCQLNRMGDVATVAGDSLFIFLFSCSINDVNLALQHIFKLPVVDVVAQHQAWHQDEAILAQLPLLLQQKPAAWLPPQGVSSALMVEAASERDLSDRRQPYAFSLPLISEL